MDTGIISLSGFMGSGKSSVGKILSDSLSCDYIDLDEYIEELDGRSIPEIFEEDGEDIFREMELIALNSILGDYGGAPLVLSLGGGTLTTPECARTVTGNSFCVYLKGSVETLVRNLDNGGVQNRPMLDGEGSLEEKVSELLKKRESIYESCASAVVSIDGKTTKEIAAEIKRLLD